jgi:hypothetical protein
LGDIFGGWKWNLEPPLLGRVGLPPRRQQDAVHQLGAGHAVAAEIAYVSLLVGMQVAFHDIVGWTYDGVSYIIRSATGATG